MVTESQRRLVDKLIERTQKGGLEWEETANPEVFQLSFPNYAIQVFPKQNRHDPEQTDVIVRIKNEEGTTVDQISDVELEQQYSGGEYFQQLMQLYETARRTALGSEEAVTELLKALDEDEDWPF